MNKKVEKNVNPSKSLFRSLVKKAPVLTQEKTVSVIKLVDVTNDESFAAKDAQSKVVTKKGFWSLASTLFGKAKTPPAASAMKIPPAAVGNLTLPFADVAPPTPPQVTDLTLPHKNLTMPTEAPNLTLPTVPPPLPPPKAQVVEPTSSGKSDSDESDSQKQSKIAKKSSGGTSHFGQLIKGKDARKFASSAMKGQTTAFPIIKNKVARVEQSPSNDTVKKIVAPQLPSSHFIPLIKKKSPIINNDNKKTGATDDVVSASLQRSRTMKNQTELIDQTKNTTAKATKSSDVNESKKKSTKSKKRKMRLKRRLPVKKFLLIITFVVVFLLATALSFVLVFTIGIKGGYESTINATKVKNSTELELITSTIRIGNNNTDAKTTLLNLLKYTRK